MGGTESINCDSALHSQQSTKDNHVKFAEVELFQLNQPFYLFVRNIH